MRMGYARAMSAKDAAFIKWMAEQFEANPAKSRSDLARLLGVHRSQVTYILQGKRKRGVTNTERETILNFFASATEPATVRNPTKLGSVVVVGRIGDHIWTVESSIAAKPLIGTPILDYPISDQAAYQLDASSKDGEFRRDDYVYTVPYGSYRSKLLLDDAVIVRRRREGLISFSLMQAVNRAGGIVLRPALGDANNFEAHDIIGLVIGTYRPRARRN